MKIINLIIISLILSCSIETDFIDDSSPNMSGQPIDMPIDTTMISMSRTGSFIATPGHSSQGSVTVTQTETGLTIEFSSNFASSNGPQLVVTLANQTFIYSSSDKELGNLKSTSGSQSYTISGINLNAYNYVHIWCRPFNTVFASAKLN